MRALYHVLAPRPSVERERGIATGAGQREPLAGLDEVHLERGDRIDVAQLALHVGAGVSSNSMVRKPTVSLSNVYQPENAPASHAKVTGIAAAGACERGERRDHHRQSYRRHVFFL